MAPLVSLVANARCLTFAMPTLSYSAAITFLVEPRSVFPEDPSVIHINIRVTVLAGITMFPMIASPHFFTSSCPTMVHKPVGGSLQPTSRR